MKNVQQKIRDFVKYYKYGDVHLASIILGGVLLCLAGLGIKDIGYVMVLGIMALLLIVINILCVVESSLADAIVTRDEEEENEIINLHHNGGNIKTV